MSFPEFDYPYVSTFTGLRACVNCHLLKTFHQFRDGGCDNCEEYLQLRNNPERILSCTNPKFEAIVGVTANNNCWGSVLQIVDKFCPGPYALYVFGNIPENILKQLFDVSFRSDEKLKCK